VKLDVIHALEVGFDQVVDTYLLWVEDVAVGSKALGHCVEEGRQFGSEAQEGHITVGVVVVEHVHSHAHRLHIDVLMVF